MHLHSWISTRMSDINKNLKASCWAHSDMADKLDNSDWKDPQRSPCCSVTPFGPGSLVTFCDATLTATVTGGVCDLCLTNGPFIILCATSMSPVFIALYFKLNPQQCSSITVAHDLYGGWGLGPREGSVWLLDCQLKEKRQFWTVSASLDHVSYWLSRLNLIHCIQFFFYWEDSTAMWPNCWHLQTVLYLIILGPKCCVFFTPFR